MSDTAATAWKFDPETGKALNEDPAASAQFAAHTDPAPDAQAEAQFVAPAGPVDGLPAASADVPTPDAPTTVSDAPSLPVDAPTNVVKVASPDLVSQIADDVATVLNLVQEMHKAVTTVTEMLPGVMAALEASPFGKMFGGLLGK